MEESAHGYGSAGWQSDNELPVDGLDSDILKAGRHAFVSGNIDNRFFGSRQERALSDGHSPVESYASDTVEDDLAIPQEVFFSVVTRTFLTVYDFEISCPFFCKVNTFCHVFSRKDT